jgi:hypothetical protein
MRFTSKKLASIVAVSTVLAYTVYRVRRASPETDLAAA